MLVSVPLVCVRLSAFPWHFLLHTRSSHSIYYHTYSDMPKSTSAIPDRVHCGCDLCQRNGKQLVPRSTYRRHKMHRNNGLSAQFNQFINAQMRISESETPNSHSDDDIPMPFNSEDDIDDVVRHFLSAISASDSLVSATSGWCKQWRPEQRARCFKFTGESKF